MQKILDWFLPTTSGGEFESKTLVSGSTKFPVGLNMSYVKCDPCLMMCPSDISPTTTGSVLSRLSPSLSHLLFSSCLSLLLLLLSPLAGSRGSGPPSSHHWLSTHLCGTASRAYELTSRPRSLPASFPRPPHPFWSCLDVLFFLFQLTTKTFSLTCSHTTDV